MHYTDAEPGGLDAELIYQPVEQTPGTIVFASCADTELAAVAETWKPLAGDGLRLIHAGGLRHPMAADEFVLQVLQGSGLVCLRLLGGQEYFSHLLQAMADWKEAGHTTRWIILPGSGDFDVSLMPWCDYPEATCRHLLNYFTQGGSINLASAGRVALALSRDGEVDFPPAEPVPEFGVYRETTLPDAPVAWHIFYRAWVQASDTAVADALHDALQQRGCSVRSLFVYSLQSPTTHAWLREMAAREAPDICITSTSFSADASGESPLFSTLGCAVLQAPISSLTRAEWESSTSGIPPAEVAMNYALPEVDGRLGSLPVGFKEEWRPSDRSQCRLRRLVPVPDQISSVAGLALRFARLRSKAPSDKKIAIILSNYPDKDSRIANGVGLDTPESCARLLQAMSTHGYDVGTPPASGEELMSFVLATMTNDTESSYGKEPLAWVSQEDYSQFFSQFPKTVQQSVTSAWPDRLDHPHPVRGVLFGQVFVGIQPPRGYGQQTQAIYHSPTLPPPPDYWAFYWWVREVFQADAMIHLGKHGNLEWLPGKSAGLSATDIPRLCLGDLPLFYPFIVNNPGEGIQAKRRASAVIVDHLTPPLVRAGLYGDLEKLENLLEEHARCTALYPQRAASVKADIEQLLASASWASELSANGSLLESADRFLCGIKENQIRGGLHILGQIPCREHLAALALSLLRVPQAGRLALMDALHGSRYDPESLPPHMRDQLEQRALDWSLRIVDGSDGQEPALAEHSALFREKLLPALRACPREIGALLAGLDGHFIAPGPSGSPARGRLDVLPTGRNFHSLDPRSAPTPVSWRCGQQIADALLETYRQQHGEYPKSIALILWGTSNMRTGGDDIAQALWLWGCEPVWDDAGGRVLDFRVLPLSLLGRPRIDVVLRISGLFRDAFGDTARLLAAAAKKVATLEEPPDKNYARAAWLDRSNQLLTEGLSPEESSDKAVLKVFTSPPGAYGCGVLPLMDAGNWENRTDIARVFNTWSSHALDASGGGSSESSEWQAQIARVDAIHQNQDNREHDILDSDDYFQFQGGLASAIEAASGQLPPIYHGDSSRPDAPKIRPISEELSRVIRSRVLNPRWREAMRRHGYKGAFEMAATVDYLHGYAATADLVTPAQFHDVASDLITAPEQRAFFLQHNPAALRDAARRLLDAAERGLWPDADPSMLEALQSCAIEAEGLME